MFVMIPVETNIRHFWLVKQGDGIKIKIKPEEMFKIDTSWLFS